MVLIYCDNCSKPHEYNYSSDHVELTCTKCNHKYTYYNINCQFYSFFISKSKLNLFNIELDKKQEYKSFTNDITNILSITNVKNTNFLQRKKSTKKNLDKYIDSFPRVATINILNYNDDNLYNKQSNYKIVSISILLYNAISNLYSKYF